MVPSASPITCPACGSENTPQARYCTNCGGALDSQSVESPDVSAQVEYGLHWCSFHPEVETGLACGRCGQYICPRCMIQTPVGARCGDCARVTRHPTYDVSTRYYLRASLAAAAVGIVGGVLWGASAGIPFLPWLLAGGVGSAVGEAVSRASNRKRGPGLVAIAVVGVTLSIISMLSVVQAFHIFLLLLFALAYYTAVIRVR